MSETTDLHAQLAQRLFGWEPLFLSADPFWRWRLQGGGFAHDPPDYTTDPAATALVWQWVEATGQMQDVTFHYHDPPSEVGCHLTYTLPGTTDFHWVFRGGATWPAALCRAALALAEALEGEEILRRGVR